MSRYDSFTDQELLMRLEECRETIEQLNSIKIEDPYFQADHIITAHNNEIIELQNAITIRCKEQ